MTDDYENRRAMASQAMVQVARLLRQQSTTSEQILWACLRNRRLGGLKFRRQHPVAHTRFSVDFLCYEAKLIVELDGEVTSTGTRPIKIVNGYWKNRVFR